MLTTTPYSDLALGRKATSRSRANGYGRNCVPNKDGADFSQVLEFDHTIAVVQSYLRPRIRLPLAARVARKPNPHQQSSESLLWAITVSVAVVLVEYVEVVEKLMQVRCDYRTGKSQIERGRSICRHSDRCAFNERPSQLGPGSRRSVRISGRKLPSFSHPLFWDGEMSRGLPDNHFAMLRCFASLPR